jgi:hypothetical protein
LVVSTAQPDDSGVETPDRFDWQAAMAAAHGLRLLFQALDDDGRFSDSPYSRIICEWHEDWVVCVGDDAELTSAKHRERSYGAYTTVNMLVNDGGLGHLFGRWCALDEKQTCRLVTTAGLKDGARSLMDAAEALRAQRVASVALKVEDDHKKVVDEFVSRLLGYKKDKKESGLPASWIGTDDEPAAATDDHVQQAMRFLAILYIDHEPPSRVHLPHAAPSMYVHPVLVRLGHDIAAAEAVWTAVLGLFRERMRAAGPTPDGKLPAVLQYRPGASPGLPHDAERELASRIVSLSDIDFAIRLAVTTLGVRPRVRMLRPTRLRAKMAHGGCSDNSIERADQLRLDYQEFWRTKEEVDHSARFARDSTRRLLLRLSDEATDAVRDNDRSWGPRFWAEVQTRIADTPVASWPEHMDADLALGGICDLSSRCQVWFGERFDVQQEITNTQPEQAA